MKKLTVLFAILIAASVMYAQKTTWVNQTGFSNDATVIQDECFSPGLDELKIFAVQSGDWNTLTTSQKGNYNYLELMQSGTYNMASMEQYTCDADATPGGDNIADVVQSGSYNTAGLIQSEDNVLGMDYSNNKSTALQSGSHNDFAVTQGRFGGTVWKPHNESFLTQSGDQNTALIEQSGLTMYSKILQTSTAVWNDATLDQGGASSSGWQKSYSYQYGAHNDIDIDQHGNPSDQYSKSIQNGLKNYTNIYQTSWGPQKVVSDQHGTDDVIYVEQVN